MPRFSPLILCLVLLVPGCSLLSGGSGNWFGPSQTEESADPKGGVHSGTFSVLKGIGTVALVAGALVFGLRVTGVAPILPGGTGLITAGSGFGLMVLTDILMAHTWILWLMIGLLLVYGGVEIVGGKKIKAKLAGWAESLRKAD